MTTSNDVPTVSQTPHTPAAKPAGECAPTGGSGDKQLRHELANLLDGSLRHIGLALSDLHDAPVGQDDELVDRLDTVNQSLQQMAAMLKHWQSRSASETDDEAAAARSTLGHAVQHCIALLTPFAHAHSISLDAQCDEAVAALPCGPIAHVIDNAVLNSIESIAGNRQLDGAVHVSATVDQGTLRISITDNGPGFDASLFEVDRGFHFGKTTKPDGHGIGLPLCRDLIAQLGGTLQLNNSEPTGAQVIATVPVANLHHGSVCTL